MVLMRSAGNRLPAFRPVSICILVLTVAAGVGAMAQESAKTRSRPATSSQDARGLIGTWELREFSRRTTDGRISAPWGSHPVGQITYGAEGRVTAVLMHQDRNEADGRTSSPEIQAEFSAYFGTYVVDPARRTVTHHVSGSVSAARASGELERSYELREGGTELVLSFTRPADGAANTLVWTRVSRASQMK